MGGVLLSGLGMMVLPGLGSPYSVGACLGALDGPIAPILAAMSTISQARIPSRLYGQVNAFRQLVSMGPGPTASVLAGLLAGRFGAGPVIEGLGAVTVMGALLLAWRTPVGRVTLGGRFEDGRTSRGRVPMAAGDAE